MIDTPAIVADGPGRLRRALAEARAAELSNPGTSDRPEIRKTIGPLRRIRRVIAAVQAAHEPLPSSRPDHRCFQTERRPR